MRRYCFLLLLAITSSAGAVAQYLPDTLFHDFETGELYGWEQYPYAQDIGYDALFFARQTPTLHQSKYALAHPVKAYDTHELYQGFTRKLNQVAVAGAQLEFGLYLQSDRAAKTLELSFGTKDGQRYFHQVPAPPANEWLLVKLPLTVFRNASGALPVNSLLEAITLEAKYDTTYYLYTYTILMDDFRLTAARPARLRVEGGYYFDQFNKSIVTALDGQVPALTVSADQGQQLTSVSGKLFAPDGKPVGKPIVFRKNGDKFTSGAISAAGKPGIWRMDLSTNDARTSTSIDLLVGSSKAFSHPRLFLSPASLKAIQQQGITEERKQILAHAMSDSAYLKTPLSELQEGEDRTGENLVGGPYAQNTVGFDSYARWHKPMAGLEKIIETTSFRYAIAGDKAAGEFGKAALLQLARFKKWNCNWMLNRKFWTYYPVGYAIKSVAYGYDMLYDLMTEAERKEVRDAMIHKGLALFHRDMVEMNRMPSNLTNHIAVLVTGFGLAAASMYGDEPENIALDKYLAGILTKTRAFIGNTYYADGSYGEPKSGYMDMATRDLSEWMAGLENVFGIDLSTTTDVENFYKFPLYATDDHGLIPAYGDGGRSYGGFTQEHAQWFVHRNGNPWLYQYVQPFWAEGKGGFLGYLWYRNDLLPKKRDALPRARPFEAQGMLIRSGWDSTSTVISTRTGPHSNHYHFDQGSFNIMTNGEELLTDPGIGTGGYYMNTEFLSYNTQSIAHNVMLVDHDPGSQVAAHFDNGLTSLSTWPVMTDTFNGILFDAVTARLASVYKDKLKTYDRQLVYRKDGPVFLWDHALATEGQTHVYDWLFHVPQNDQKRTCTYSGNRFLVETPQARLTMDVLYPKTLSSGIRDRSGNTNTYLNYNSKYFSESFLTLSTETASAATDFLAVMLPEAGSGPAKSLAPAQLLEGNGWKGVSFKTGEEEDLLYVRTTNDSSVALNDIQTDADKVVLSKTATGQHIFFTGKQLQYGEWNIIASNRVALAATRNGKTVTLDITAPRHTVVDISAGGKPKLANKSSARISNNGIQVTTVQGKTTIHYEIL